MRRTQTPRRYTAALLVIVAILLFTPTVTAKDFVIQNQTGTPILVANGTSNNVGIGLLNPSYPLAVNGQTLFSDNVNLSGNAMTGIGQLQDFFAGDPGTGGGACPLGQFVQAINADGSYTCDSAASGMEDEFVNRSGDSMIGRLNMTNNSINNVSYINEFGNKLWIGGDIAMTGNNINDVNDITGTDIINNPQIAPNAVDTAEINTGAVTSDELGTHTVNTTHIINATILEADLNTTNTPLDNQFLTYDDGTGGFTWVPNPDTVEDEQNLSEVLVHGNRANMTIDMNLNNIVDVNALSVGQPLTDNNISDGITIDGTGTVYDTALSDQGTLAFDWQDGEVADSITVGPGGRVDGAFVTVGDPLDTQNISDSAITSAKINVDAVGNREVDNTANLDLNSLSVDQGLETGNISNGAITNIKLSSTAVSGSAGSGNNVIEGDSIDSAEIAQNAIGGSELDDSGSFTMNDLTVTGPGVSAFFQNDVQIQGSLDVWGNITNTQVNEVSVNGILLPPDAYNATFNLGNSSNWWKHGYFGGNIRVAGVVDGVDINNPDTGIEVNNQRLRISTGAAGDGLTGGGSNPLAVDYDDTTITTDINGILQVKANGIGTNELANNAVGSDQVQPATVNTTHIAVGAVQNTDISNDAVNRTQIRQSGCGDEDVLKWNATSTQWECQPDVNTNTDSQDLADVLSRGNQTNGQDIDMNGASVRSSSGEICIGDQCT